MKKHILLLISTILLFSCISQVSASSNSSYSDSLLDTSSQILPVSLTKTLLVDKINHQIQLLDLSTGKIAWSKKFPTLYDCEILTKPTKIIVITEESNHSRKVTFSEEGKQLSQQIFSAIKLNGNQKLQWSAARLQEKEKLALVRENNLLVYQYPWKKAVINISNVVPVDMNYENTILQDIQFQSPYVIIKINGRSLTQSQDNYKIINLVTKQVNTIPLAWNVNSNFTIDGSALVVNTSSISGNPLGIETNVEQLIYARYDLKTSKMETSIKKVFTMSDSNWSSSYFNGYLLTTDMEQNQHNLQRKGQVIAQRPATATDLNSRMIGYYDGHVYNLTWISNKVELRVD